MMNFKNDIKDDEIRIIQKKTPSSRKAHKAMRLAIISVAVIAAAVVTIILLSRTTDTATDAPTGDTPSLSAPEEETYSNVKTPVKPGKSCVYATDTVVDGTRITLLYPDNAIPALSVGDGCLNDSTVILAVRAADVRQDNKGIVGACVVDGNLISRGKSKAGFCAIIDGEMTIGTAINTAFLEKATETGGYFFRQYPLVVEGQPIDNKPRNSSLRKALVEIDGRIAVVLSHEPLTFSQFAQTLSTLGVRNAIYLVGSTSFGFYRDCDGQSVEFGTKDTSVSPNATYLTWR